MDYTKTREIDDYLKHVLKPQRYIHFDCSSSHIRALCRNGGSITGLVSENVEEYIIKNGLYKD